MADGLNLINLRVVYIPEWTVPDIDGVKWFGFSDHEIEAKYMPDDLRNALTEFVCKVEIAHDK